MKIVKIKELVKRFDEVVAVDNISIEIEQGEIYGFLGPNGSGKSTTINIMSGLLTTDKGSIEIFGKSLGTNLSEIRENIGIVAQDNAIYEDLTFYENVYFFAGLYGLRGKALRQNVEAALKFTELLDKANSYPGKFSDGIKKKLNIACSIAHKPALVIMDEPTVGIEHQSVDSILQLVKKLNEHGCTIIYTSHYIEEIEEICSKVAIIDHGKVIAEGTKEELKSIITNTNNVCITLDSIKDLEIDKLKEINGVLNIEVKENVVNINSSSDVNNLDKITQYFASNNMSIKDIESKRPDLDTVFLTLTGRSLRD